MVSTQLTVGLVAFTILTIALGIFRGKFKLIFNDFKSWSFNLLLILVLIISWNGLRSENKRVVHATEKAITGFLVAYVAHVDLIFAAFFLVWIFVYFEVEKPTPQEEYNRQFRFF